MAPVSIFFPPLPNYSARLVFTAPVFTKEYRFYVQIGGCRNYGCNVISPTGLDAGEVVPQGALEARHDR